MPKITQFSHTGAIRHLYFPPTYHTPTVTERKYSPYKHHHKAVLITKIVSSLLQCAPSCTTVCPIQQDTHKVIMIMVGHGIKGASSFGGRKRL